MVTKTNDDGPAPEAQPFLDELARILAEDYARENKSRRSGNNEETANVKDRP